MFILFYLFNLSINGSLTKNERKLRKKCKYYPLNLCGGVYGKLLLCDI